MVDLSTWLHRSLAGSPLECDCGGGSRVVDLSTWLDRSDAWSPLRPPVECGCGGGGRVVDLLTWLHRSLACLLANLHVKIEL